MGSEFFEWALLLTRWFHITVAITWIGTSIFFMWLDRSFEVAEGSKKPGYLGELWMVHGGGFYRVEKLKMGEAQVERKLHWFKWESYWTWVSGVILLALLFYTGEGALLLDYDKDTTYGQALFICLGSIAASWFFYDFIWERQFIREKNIVGHGLTLAWVLAMAYGLCYFLGGRGAYMHMGAILGTWMAGNVFLRIIPRQTEMVRASQTGETVNPSWSQNAKNRSTHNTYFTLPIIFIMMSNHFPATYGSTLNWFILLTLGSAGAAIRHFFIIRNKTPMLAKGFLAAGFLLLAASIYLTREFQ